MTPAAALAVAADGWCAGAARYASPHCDARPDGAEAELLVIHNVSLPAGRFGGPHVSDLFTGRLDYNADPSFADLRGLRVSAHFFVRRDGRLIQYVSGNDKAWHAGLSAFRGRPRCNEFSIGVELEGSDVVAFTASQYATLAALTAALQARYRLRDVCGHEHIAAGRKTDPGPCFDWNLYKKTLCELLVRQGALVPTYRQLGFPATV
ncbi:MULTISPECIES: 1,6-anhydro-N-acetylmuramyl-L-alanine amidase AmpD [unclassified Janthinobacterium]|uniref:1,6-anhydro-N-acetylmuramyl-L-alanine amidase AmpD n=1 Tax=unclassified Janthinobacterium TaxID=2610881 RepID=UPI000346689D|nr:MULTISPECIES: 1,6-anhydro-N-acetylmuramyl-L-alanine amidase AmpD [unclassified Janthinobacterium]MEC5159602.1 AmpD protein [Janthinobacterium sp. CG_S6]